MCAPLVFPSFYSFLGSALLFLVSLFLTTPPALLQDPSLSGWLPTSVPVSGSWLGQK